MDISKELVDKVLNTLFPKPEYDSHKYAYSHGFDYYLYDERGYEVFSIYYHVEPIMYFIKPVKYQSVFTTLNEVFNLNHVGTHRYEIKGIK
jgi:hypothetical protein